MPLIGLLPSLKVLIGYRLDQPPGCPQQIYDVMFSSWQAVSPPHTTSDHSYCSRQYIVNPFLPADKYIVNPFLLQTNIYLTPSSLQSPEARPSFKELLASLKQLLDYSDATE